MFEELLARVDDVEITSTVSRVRSNFINGIKSLPVRVRPPRPGEMRLLVIQHDPDKGLGLLEGPLRDAGADLDIRFAGRDPLKIGDHAGVVALPGIANPPDATEAIAATRSSLADALDRELPILAICLGAELLAEAAGAKSYSCPPQYGYWPVSLTDEGTHDPLLAGLPRRFDAFQAHGFATELPDGALALAHAGEELQAFRVRDRAWGLQFHPEPTEEMITGWLQFLGPPMEKQGMQPEDVAAQSRRDVPVWSELGAGIAHGSSKWFEGRPDGGVVGILEGRRILVTGVLTDDSLAFGPPASPRRRAPRSPSPGSAAASPSRPAWPASFPPAGGPRARCHGPWPG